MKLETLNKTLAKYWEPKLIAYIAAPRYCSKCAKKGWENKELDQTVYIRPGICGTCEKFGLVGYIEEM